jgi:putative glycosyltransferase (TIGR04372 family)
MKISRPFGFSKRIRCLLIESKIISIILIQPHNEAYGHALSDISMSTSLAKNKNALLLILPAWKNPNPALLDMKSEDIRIYKSPKWIAYLISLLIWDIFLLISPYRISFFRWLRDNTGHLAKKLNKNKNIFSFLGIPLANLAKWLKRNYKYLTEKNTAKRSYLRRKLIATPTPLKLSKKWERHCTNGIKAIGLDLPSSKIAILHIRESGYKSSQNPYEQRSHMRNADISNYQEALTHLVDNGYTIVKIGDKSMRPIKMNGLIDLASSEYNSPALELYIMQHAKLFILSESGPMYTPLLFNDVPALLANFSNTYFCYPIRKNERFLLKKVVKKKTSHTLSIYEMLEEEYVRHRLTPEYYDFIDNSNDELLSAIKEMLQIIEGINNPSQEQLLFREKLTSTAPLLSNKILPPKWGAEDGFWGHGYISNCLFQK